MFNKFFPTLISSAKTTFGKVCESNKKETSGIVLQLRRICSAGANMRIYVDTCTLLHQYGSPLLDAVESVFPKYGMELLVPASVLYELENVGNKNSAQREKSREMIERITALEQNGIAHIVLTNSPKFTDAGLLSRFVSECQKYDIILLTQDQELTKKAIQLPSFLDGCINRTHEIKVLKLNANGCLTENDDCHMIERKVITHEKNKIHCREQLPYPYFYSNV